MSYGMPFGGKMKAPKTAEMKASKKLPQGDRTAGKVMAAKVGPDDINSKKMAENMTAPKMPQRDGPARDNAAGAVAGKPPTSAPAGKTTNPSGMTKKTLKSMKASLGSIGSY